MFRELLFGSALSQGSTKIIGLLSIVGAIRVDVVKLQLKGKSESILFKWSISFAEHMCSDATQPAAAAVI